jgi:hypothetical protein
MFRTFMTHIVRVIIKQWVKLSIYRWPAGTNASNGLFGKPKARDV